MKRLRKQPSIGTTRRESMAKIVDKSIIDGIYEALDKFALDAWQNGYKEGCIDTYRKYQIGNVVNKLGNVEWNTTEEPKRDGEYLVTCVGAMYPTTLYYEEGRWVDWRGETYVVAAWAHLPQAYKEV